VSSAYNVAEVGNDAHGNPAKTFVRKTSWDHAVQMELTCSASVAVSTDTGAHHVDMHDASGMLAREPSTRTALERTTTRSTTATAY
jgi:hypothetical protein